MAQNTARENQAAWFEYENQNPLVVKSSKYPTITDNTIIVQNKAVGINPVDWKVQDVSAFPFEYPLILGEDVAGVVVETGSNVTNFKVGDRVLGHSILYAPHDSQGFQLFTLVDASLASKIPDALPFEQAVAVPLAISTGGLLLYAPGMVELPPPSLDPVSINKTLIIWGGSTTVGISTIQMAKASGVEVIATSSPRNFDLLKKLGVDHVFDYNSSSVEDDIWSVLEGKTLAGACDCATFNGPNQSLLNVVAKANGNKFITTVLPVKDDLPDGVQAKFVLADHMKDTAMADNIYRKYLPQALEQGKFVALPEPMIVGHGLDKIQEAFNVHKKGVSAKKVVVTL